MCSDSIVTQQRAVWYVHDVVWYCAHLTEEVKEFHLGKRTNLFIDIHDTNVMYIHVAAVL